MASRSYYAQSLVFLSALALPLIAFDIGKAFSQVNESSAIIEEPAVVEPNLEDQLIKSLLRIRDLEASLRDAEQKLKTLSSNRTQGEQGSAEGKLEYLPQNGREEICIQSVLDAMRNDAASVNWKLSCGEKLIGSMVGAERTLQSGSTTDDNTMSPATPFTEVDPENESGQTVLGTTVEPVIQPAVSNEPYLIVIGEDGNTPLMRQQREISAMKLELLASSECPQAGKWLVDAAKEDLLLFSFFVVDRGQIGRCVPTNSGWRVERAGPFDEGYVLKSNR